MIGIKCTTNTVSKPKRVYDLGIDGYSFHVYYSIQDFENLWKSHEANCSVFMRIPYFKSLEASHVDDLQMRYLLLYDGDTFVAFYPIQLKYFQAHKSIRNIEEDTESIPVRKSLAKYVNVNTMIAGNIIVSGELMFHYLDESIAESRRFVITEKLLDRYRDILKKENYTVSLMFAKDLAAHNTGFEDKACQSGFKEFEVEPIMVFYIDPAWNSYQDYLAAMVSKYRVRAKRAKKKSEHLNYRLFTEADIEANKHKLHELYLNVFENIEFSLFKLDENYFLNLQRYLKEDFRLFVVEDEAHEILGFYTLINNGDELHAHFLGYDKAMNTQCQIYLNMLYLMVDIGIREGYKRIDMGRTALEIKSSVGAVPKDHNLYLKFNNKLVNLFLNRLIGILNKKTDWQQRHPFK